MGDTRPRGSGASSKRETVARRARGIIEKSFADDDCDTRAIARRLGVTRSRLCHFYRDAYDSTVGQDIRSLRVEAACRLLEADPGALIKEVAGAVGFGRRSYRTFLNSFRQEMGVPPREYQRQAAVRRMDEDWRAPQDSAHGRRATGSGRRRD